MRRQFLMSASLVRKGLLALVISFSAVAALIVIEGIVLHWLGFQLFNSERRFSVLQFCPPHNTKPGLMVHWLCGGLPQDAMRNCLELVDSPQDKNGQAFHWRGIAPRSAVWTGDAEILALGSAEGTLYTWNASNRERRPRTLGKHAGCAEVLDATADGRWLAAASDLATALWDLTTRQQVWVRHDLVTTDLCIHPHRSCLACGTARGDVIELDLASGLTRRTIAKHEAGIACLAVSADGARLATVGQDHVLMMTDWNTGEVLWTRPHHVNSEVCFSPCGKTLVTSGFVDDAWTILTWQALSGHQQFRLLGHRSVILGLTMTSDRTLFSWGAEGVVHQWDLRRRVLTQTWIPSPPAEVEANDAEFNATGS